MLPLRLVAVPIVLALIAACTTYSPPPPTAAESAKARGDALAMEDQYRQSLIASGFIDWDAPNLSPDEIRAIAVAKGVVASDQYSFYLFKLERTESSWHIIAMPWGGRDARGWPTIPLPGAFLSIRISSDWKQIQVAGGA